MDREVARVKLRLVAAFATVVAIVVGLSACSGPELVKGSTVTVAMPTALTSLNPKTSFGNTAMNAAVSSATSSQFAAYDDQPKLVTDPSFGSYTVVSQRPFVVRFTVAPGVTWSDGVPVDAADLMLAWAANSGSRNTPKFDPTQYQDADGRLTKPLPAGVVHFDGFSGNGLNLVTKTPVVSDDQRSITLTYARYFADWRLVFGVGLPAHVVASTALGIRNAAKSKSALIAAVKTDDIVKLAKLARVWNTGYDLDSTPKNRALLVSDGPYTIGSISSSKVTLVANPRYTGAHKPQFERVVLKVISDPLAAVAALKGGEVDVATPQPSADVDSALTALRGARITRGIDGPWEQLDLQFSHGRNATFQNPIVRRAFLEVVPRQQILDRLVAPLQKGAKLRDSLVFLPRSDGYSESVRQNGSADFSDVDVAGATALLKKAGVSAPQVCLLFDPSNPRRVAEYTLIKASAARAGFVVTDCSSSGWRDLLGTPGAYDAALYALRPSSIALSSVSASFSSKSTIDNTSFFADPQVDALIATLDTTQDDATQRALMRRIDARLFAVGYGLPLFQFPAVTVARNTVSGASLSPLPPGVLWNIWAWKPVVKG